MRLRAQTFARRPASIICNLVSIHQTHFASKSYALLRALFCFIAFARDFVSVPKMGKRDVRL
jgi:hypothetical protein